MLIFTFALLYCDSVLRENLEVHAMRRSAAAGVLWTWLHVVVGFTLFIIGVSIKLCFSAVVHDEPVENDYNYMLGMGCGTTLTLLVVMRGTHKGLLVMFEDGASPRTLKRVGNYFLRLLFALAHFLVAVLSEHEKEVTEGEARSSRDHFLYIHTFLAATSVILEVVAAQFVNREHVAHNHGEHDDVFAINEAPRSDNDASSRIDAVEMSAIQ